MNKKIKFFSVIVIIILCICLCHISLNDTNDTFYLIKLGESISKYGLDMKDHFSWITNLPYTYPHWLYSVFLFFIYNNFDFVGIYFSMIITFIIMGLLVYYVNLKFNKNSFLALIFSIISIITLSIFMLPRSQSISIIFLFLEIYFINQLIETGKIKYSVYLSLCSLLIANIHATIWIVFFVFFLPFIFEHIMFLLSQKYKKIYLGDRISINKVKNIKLLLITFIICFLMGIFTPSRICYSYIFKIMMGNSQEYISEHAPLVLIKYPLIIVCYFLLFFTKSKIKLSEFCMVSGLLLMCLISQRHLIFFSTIGILYFSIILKRNIDEMNDKTFDIIEKKIDKMKIVPGLLIISLILISYVNVNKNIQNGFFDEREYPIKAVQYIKSNLDYSNIKIINNYNFGSYLLFNDIKVFVDSRCDLYLREFNGLEMDILDDYANVINYHGEKTYDDYLQTYDAKFFLVYKTDFIYQLLKVDNQYIELYQDDNYALYEKKGE